MTRGPIARISSLAPAALAAVLAGAPAIPQEAAGEAGSDGGEGAGIARAETANRADWEVFEADPEMVFTDCVPFAMAGARCGLGGAVADQHLCLALGPGEEPLAQEVLLPGTEHVTFADISPRAIEEIRCRQLAEEAPGGGD
jgi:hypothetical protein